MGVVFSNSIRLVDDATYEESPLCHSNSCTHSNICLPPHTLTHPICPLKDGFFLQDIIVIESLENVRHTGQELWVHLPHQDLKRTQEVFLAFAVVQNKLRGGCVCVCVHVCLCEQTQKRGQQGNDMLVSK